MRHCISFLPNKIYNRIWQHQASLYQKLSAYLKCWYFYIKGLVALKLQVPHIVRLERLLTCFIKSRQSLCSRLKINTKVSGHSVVVYSAIILQTERSAGTRRSLSCNQAAITVAEGCRHTHTYTLTHRRGTHFYQYMLNCPLVPDPAARTWDGFQRVYLVLNTGSLWSKMLGCKKNFLKIKLKKKDWRIFISSSCVWFVKPEEMLIEAVVERWATHQDW